MKKAQIQTMETIAVLFIFFVLLMFGIVFYVGYARGRAHVEVGEFHQAQSIQIAESVIDLPELQDTRQGISSINCFDILKIDAFSSLMSEDESLRQGIYQERFRDSLIVLHEVFPGNKSWILYNNTKPSFLYSNPFFIPKCIYDPLLHQRGYAVGLLEVNYFSE